MYTTALTDSEGAHDFTIKISGDHGYEGEYLFALSEVKCPILRMQSTNMSLEEVFLKLTNDEGKLQDKGMEGEK